MDTKARNHWNPARVVLCTCGWSGKFRTLAVANDAIAVHLEEGTEGCDHAVDISLAPEDRTHG